MNFYNRIPADYVERIDTSVLYRYGVRDGGGYGPLKWRGPIQVAVSSFEGEEHYMRLQYRIRDTATNERLNLDYKIPLITTACTFGGKRFWFECTFCNRRVGVLYRREDYFACRHCNYLTYESKLVSGKFKPFGRIISIPEMKELEKKVKREIYNGKPTKNYTRYKKMETKFWRAFNGHFKVRTAE